MSASLDGRLRRWWFSGSTMFRWPPRADARRRRVASTAICWGSWRSRSPSRCADAAARGFRPELSRSMSEFKTTSPQRERLTRRFASRQTRWMGSPDVSPPLEQSSCGMTHFPGFAGSTPRIPGEIASSSSPPPETGRGGVESSCPSRHSAHASAPEHERLTPRSRDTIDMSTGPDMHERLTPRLRGCDQVSLDDASARSHQPTAPPGTTAHALARQTLLPFNHAGAPPRQRASAHREPRGRATAGSAPAHSRSKPRGRQPHRRTNPGAARLQRDAARLDLTRARCPQRRPRNREVLDRQARGVEERRGL